MSPYTSGSQSLKKRKVVNLTQDDEDDEAAESLAQSVLAGMRLTSL
jgi:hypothetical protein